MRPYTIFCLIASALCLPGCNQPAVSLKPLALQASENTVRDWKDIALAVSTEMAARGFFPAAGWPSKPFLNPHSQAPDFSLYPLRRGRTGGRYLAARRYHRPHIERRYLSSIWMSISYSGGLQEEPPGLLGTGAAVADPSWHSDRRVGADVHLDSGGRGRIYGSRSWKFLSDAIIAMTPTMNAEAIWKATILADDRVVMKIQQPVYIRTVYIPLYAKGTSLGPSSSDSGGGPLRALTIRYDQ